MDALLVGYISKHLSVFLKGFSKDQIRVRAFKGEGVLSSFDLNEQAIHDYLYLSDFLEVKQVHCDKMRVKVPWTKAKQEPTVIVIDHLRIDLEESVNAVHAPSPTAPGGRKEKKEEKHRLMDKILEGLRFEIAQIRVTLCLLGNKKSRAQGPWVPPMFDLDIHNAKIYTTNHSWKVVPLQETRHINHGQKEHLLFKEGSFESVSVSLIPYGSHDNPIPVIKDTPATLRIKIKRLVGGPLRWMENELAIGKVHTTFDQALLQHLTHAIDGLLSCLYRIPELNVEDTCESHNMQQEDSPVVKKDSRTRERITEALRKVNLKRARGKSKVLDDESGDESGSSVTDETVSSSGESRRVLAQHEERLMNLFDVTELEMDQGVRYFVFTVVVHAWQLLLADSGDKTSVPRVFSLSGKEMECHWHWTDVTQKASAQGQVSPSPWQESRFKGSVLTFKVHEERQATKHHSANVVTAQGSTSSLSVDSATMLAPAVTAQGISGETAPLASLKMTSRWPYPPPPTLAMELDAFFNPVNVIVVKDRWTRLLNVLLHGVFIGVQESRGESLPCFTVRFEGFRPSVLFRGGDEHPPLKLGLNSFLFSIDPSLTAEAQDDDPLLNVLHPNLIPIDAEETKFHMQLNNASLAFVVANPTTRLVQPFNASFDGVLYPGALSETFESALSMIGSWRLSGLDVTLQRADCDALIAILITHIPNVAGLIIQDTDTPHALSHEILVRVQQVIGWMDSLALKLAHFSLGRISSNAFLLRPFRIVSLTHVADGHVAIESPTSQLADSQFTQLDAIVETEKDRLVLNSCVQSFAGYCSKLPRPHFSLGGFRFQVLRSPHRFMILHNLLEASVEASLRKRWEALEGRYSLSGPNFLSTKQDDIHREIRGTHGKTTLGDGAEKLLQDLEALLRSMQNHIGHAKFIKDILADTTTTTSTESTTGSHGAHEITPPNGHRCRFVGLLLDQLVTGPRAWKPMHFVVRKATLHALRQRQDVTSARIISLEGAHIRHIGTFLERQNCIKITTERETHHIAAPDMDSMQQWAALLCLARDGLLATDEGTEDSVTGSSRPVDPEQLLILDHDLLEGQFSLSQAQERVHTVREKFLEYRRALARERVVRTELVMQTSSDLDELIRWARDERRERHNVMFAVQLDESMKREQQKTQALEDEVADLVMRIRELATDRDSTRLKWFDAQEKLNVKTTDQEDLRKTLILLQERIEENATLRNDVNRFKTEAANAHAEVLELKLAYKKHEEEEQENQANRSKLEQLTENTINELIHTKMLLADSENEKEELRREKKGVQAQLQIAREENKKRSERYEEVRRERDFLVQEVERLRSLRSH